MKLLKILSIIALLLPLIHCSNSENDQASQSQSIPPSPRIGSSANIDTDVDVGISMVDADLGLPITAFSTKNDGVTATIAYEDRSGVLFSKELINNNESIVQTSIVSHQQKFVTADGVFTHYAVGDAINNVDKREGFIAQQDKHGVKYAFYNHEENKTVTHQLNFDSHQSIANMSMDRDIDNHVIEDPLLKAFLQKQIMPAGALKQMVSHMRVAKMTPAYFPSTFETFNQFESFRCTRVNNQIGFIGLLIGTTTIHQCRSRVGDHLASFFTHNGVNYAHDADGGILFPDSDDDFGYKTFLNKIAADAYHAALARYRAGER